jgi:Lrp/AsnC family transcriptional regulator for asnA, asnC and gidA
MKIDETDRGIISILEKNGRVPNNEVAARLAISEGTVRNRIKKLTDNNYLKIRGQIDPDANSEKQLIFILVKLVITKRWREIAEKVSLLPNVKSVSMITGRFDLIVEVYIEHHSLIDFLTHDLAEVGDISSTESLVTIGNFNKWV